MHYQLFYCLNQDLQDFKIHRIYSENPITIENPDSDTSKLGYYKLNLFCQ